MIWKQHDAETPQYVQDLVLFHHSSASRIRLLYNELMSEYMWLDCILKGVEGDLLNITNIAVLFCHSEDITFLMQNDSVLSERHCVMLIQDLMSISKMALEITIRLMWSSVIPQVVKSRIGNAALRLYGKNDTGIRYDFDSKSVSFYFTNSKMTVKAQTLFESKVETMIQDLSRVRVPRANKHEEQLSLTFRALDPENSTSAVLDIMAYQELLIVGFSRDCDFNTDDVVIPSLVIELSHLYFASYLYPVIGSRVRMKNRNNISRIFESVNRDDYQFWMKKYNDAVGTVTAHHITNGVEVEFQEKDGNTKRIWYEPFCFSQIDGHCIKMENRYFVDDKVHWFMDPKRTTLKTLKLRMDRRDLAYLGKVGWIEPYELDLKKGITDCSNVISVSFAGHAVRVKHLPAECVKPSGNIFGHDAGDDAMAEVADYEMENDLSFSKFKVGEVVQVKSDYAHVQAGFEMAGRDDCWDFMRPFCGQKGHIVRFHATNGVCVQLAYPQAIWYEPPCLEKLAEDGSDGNQSMSHIGKMGMMYSEDGDGDDDAEMRYHREERLHLGTKVKLSWKKHKYHGRVGKVVLHFPKIRNREGYKTVSVKFGNEVIHTLPSTITVVSKFYE